MIYDTIANAALYQGMSPHLDRAIDFMLTKDLNALPMGRTEIDGSNVFCNKMEAQTLPAEEKLFEMHRVYMDIQIDLKGSEEVRTGEIRGFACPDFSEEQDVGFGDCPTVASCVLTPGSFTLCLAGEPHKPGIRVGDDPDLVKCVLKVRA